MFAVNAHLLFSKLKDRYLKAVCQKIFFMWESMPMLRFIRYVLPELFKKKKNWNSYVNKQPQVFINQRISKIRCWEEKKLPMWCLTNSLLIIIFKKSVPSQHFLVQSQQKKQQCLCNEKKDYSFFWHVNGF